MCATTTISTLYHISAIILYNACIMDACLIYSSYYTSLLALHSSK